jgi:hypothetical protein
MKKGKKKMNKYVVDVTIEVEAKNAIEAWNKANGLVSDIEGVEYVSEPEKIS